LYQVRYREINVLFPADLPAGRQVALINADSNQKSAKISDSDSYRNCGRIF